MNQNEYIEALQELTMRHCSGVIAHMMQSATSTMEVLESGLTQDFFRHESHKIVFSACAMVAMEQDVVDITVLHSFLLKANKLDQIGGLSELWEMANFEDGTPLSVHLDAVKENQRRYQLAMAMDTATYANVYDLNKPAAEILADHQMQLDEIRSSLHDRSTTGAFTKQDWHDWINRPDSQGMAPGLSPRFDELYRAAPGQLVVITGHPNAGKSHLAGEVMGRLALNHKMRGLIWSSEHSMASTVEKIIRPVSGVAFHEGRPATEEGAAAWDKWLDWGADMFRYFNNPSDSNKLSMILSTARAVMGVWPFEMLYIDPWTDLSTERPGYMSETEWHKDQLAQLRAFTKRHNLTTFVVAHPVKQLEYSEQPNLKTISGSAHFSNMADVGITAFNLYWAGQSENRNDNEVIVTKMRESSNGKLGKAKFQWLPTTWKWWGAEDDEHM